LYSQSKMADPLENSDFVRLPQDVANLLRRTSSPPRLIAHLILVHDVAFKLVQRIAQVFPNVPFDREAVLFGAATHDIGKALDVAELMQPGKEHEKHGFELLRALEINEDRARFAYTHGNWATIPDARLEDLLVALADNCWKGKRVDELETKTVSLLSSPSGKPMWDCYAELDDILTSLAADADARLAWQSGFHAERVNESSSSHL
jgi:putative nucleotidyltransferase with HDIG domain